MIKLEHISKSFEGCSILNNLNYSFPEHEPVGTHPEPFNALTHE